MGAHPRPPYECRQKGWGVSVVRSRLTTGTAAARRGHCKRGPCPRHSYPRTKSGVPLRRVAWAALHIPVNVDAPLPVVGLPRRVCGKSAPACVRQE